MYRINYSTIIILKSKNNLQPLNTRKRIPNQK